MRIYILVLLFSNLFAGTQEVMINVIDIKLNNVVLKSMGTTDLIAPKVKYSGIAKLNLNTMCKEQPNHIWCINKKQKECYEVYSK